MLDLIKVATSTYHIVASLDDSSLGLVTFDKVAATLRRSGYPMADFKVQGGAPLNGSSQWLLVQRSPTLAIRAVFFHPDQNGSPSSL